MTSLADLSVPYWSWMTIDFRYPRCDLLGVEWIKSLLCLKWDLWSVHVFRVFGSRCSIDAWQSTWCKFRWNKVKFTLWHGESVLCVSFGPKGIGDVIGEFQLVRLRRWFPALGPVAHLTRHHRRHLPGSFHTRMADLHVTCRCTCFQEGVGWSARWTATRRGLAFWAGGDYVAGTRALQGGGCRPEQNRRGNTRRWDPPAPPAAPASAWWTWPKSDWSATWPWRGQTKTDQRRTSRSVLHVQCQVPLLCLFSIGKVCLKESGLFQVLWYFCNGHDTDV